MFSCALNHLRDGASGKASAQPAHAQETTRAHAAEVTESVLTVGVDATTGEVRHPQMRVEVINADFLSFRAARTTTVS